MVVSLITLSTRSHSTVGHNKIDPVQMEGETETQIECLEVSPQQQINGTSVVRREGIFHTQIIPKNETWTLRRIVLSGEGSLYLYNTRGTDGSRNGQETNDEFLIAQYKIKDVFAVTTTPDSEDNNASLVYLHLYPSPSRGNNKRLGCCSPGNVICGKPGSGVRNEITIVVKINKGNHEESKRTADEWRSEVNELIQRSIGPSNVNVLRSASHERRILAVLNPKSGRQQAVKICGERVGPLLQKCGVQLELFITERENHAFEKMQTINLSGVDAIITVGGDGILYEVINGLRKRDTDASANSLPLGVISSGSGNGLARSLAHYSGESKQYLRDPVLSSTLHVLKGNIVPMNLMQVELDGVPSCSFLSIGCGLLADIDIESERLRFMGESRYTLWAYYRVIDLKTYRNRLSYIEFSDDDRVSPFRTVVEGHFMFIHASFVSHIGTDIYFAPTSCPGDGIIHLTFLEGRDATRVNALRFLLGLDNGSHLNMDAVHYVKVKEFIIEGPDGKDIQGTITIDGEKVVGKKLLVRSVGDKLSVLSM